MAGFETWEAALAEPLYLFFEANLSPGAYLGWLRHHLGERTLIPYVSEAATVAGARLEGATKVDAMLLAPRTDVAIVFEAMVLSDVSTSVTFDASRNQLARTIDVLLAANPKLAEPLSAGRTATSFSQARVRGW